MNAHRLLVSSVLATSLLWTLTDASAQQPPSHPGLDTAGFKENRDYLSQFPFEHIDTVSGALILTFSDLALPGNAGHELKFQRTYNSKQGGLWRFGLSGYALSITVPDPPDGSPDPSERTPILNRVDGGSGSMAWYSGTSPIPFDAISRDFWRFDRSTGALQIPNGDVCQYGGSNGLYDETRRVQSCVDAFGNQIDFVWHLTSSPYTLVITQHLSGTSGRQITITFADASATDAVSLEYEGRTWNYSRSDATPPAGTGNGWHFTYDGNDVASVTTPNGGKTTYVYENILYVGPTPLPDQYWTRAVVRRTTRDRDDTQLGEWVYEYQFNANAASGVTIVTTPSRRIVYEHGAATGTSPAALFDGAANLSVLSRAVQQYNGSTWVTLELEQRAYEYVPVTLIMGTEELQSVTIFRDNGTTPYVTTYAYSETNSGEYHHPESITETGPAGSAATRTTQFTYRHCPSSPECPGVYVTGLPLTEQLTVNGQTFSKSWTYDADGFQTSETVYGIKTDFGKGQYGNVGSSRTAMDKLTSYTYDFGAIQQIETPEYTVSRQINSDGSIHSETRAGRTTVFEYDDLGRLVEMQPPGGAYPTLISYDEDGRSVTTTRPASPNAPYPETTETLDAFGRSIEVSKIVTRAGNGAVTSVATRTEYDAEGRVTQQTHPFSSGTLKWTAFTYDILGRVTRVTNPDGTYATRTYGADGNVAIVNERNQSTTQFWRAVGNPDKPQLVGLQDANGKFWDYTYNALGNLTSVTSQAEAGGPGPLTRLWTYNSANLLEAESHPELGSIAAQGSITYVYDLAGQLIRKQDANGKYTYFDYDGNDRVKRITADGRVTLITYEPGSDNRKSAVKAGSAVSWIYDQAGRLQSRRDGIAGKVFTTTFEYDDFDNLRTIQHPTGRRIQYDVDAAGRPTRIFEAAAGRDYATNITYHPFGGVASYLSNGVTTSIEYDANRQWVTSITSGDLQLTYSQYDAVGNPTQIGDNRPNYSQSFSYDGLDRLIAAAGVYGTTQYTYNLHGNRTGNYQYESNKLRLASQTIDNVTTTFTYDNNGNTLTAGNATFAYTPDNQVERATVPGSVTTYAYDADDQRVRKTTGTNTSYFVRGPGGELLTEWMNPGTATGRARDYIYLGTRLLSAVARNRTDDPVGDAPPPSTQSHRYATSWQVPSGNGDNVTLNSGITNGARKSFHPEMTSTGLRIGTQSSGTVNFMANGPQFPNNDPNNPKQGGVFIEFEIERRPFTSDGEWLGSLGGFNSIEDLRMYITPAGALVIKHDDGRGTPQTLYTSAPIELRTTHTVEVRFEYNSNGTFVAPNPLWENMTSHAEVFFDGGQVGTYGASPGGTYDNAESNPLGWDLKTGLGAVGAIKLKSPGPANGLLMNIFRAGITSAQSHGDTLPQYGNTWRTTLLQAAGPGTYSQWTGGQPDWRAHSAVHFQIGSLNSVTTTTPNQKISYLMESMLSRGITGNIGVVMVGIRNGYATTGAMAFIRRNGVETLLPNFTLPSSTNAGVRWYRVSEGGWLPTDEIEVGMVSGTTTGNNYLTSVALLVEHDTPEPEPLTDTTARVVTVSYTGNGTGQTIDLGVDMVPTALLVTPLDDSARPVIWWDGRPGAQGFAEANATFGRVWPQKGKFQVVEPTAGDSYNANGVSYTAIALFDPSGRYAIPFGVSKPSAEDDYNHQLRLPLSGEPAATFTPDFVFGGMSSTTSSDSTFATFYKGPGHAGDLTAKIGTSQAADADRIQAMTAGQVQFGKWIGSQYGDTSFWAGRVSDGVAPQRLMAVTSYVGDGTSSRNIPLILNGQTPVFSLVMPVNAAVAKIYRVAGDTTGRQTWSGNATANSITAMGANQITVGSALNAVGVTYDVWTITTGFVAAQQ